MKTKSSIASFNNWLEPQCGNHQQYLIFKNKNFDVLYDDVDSFFMSIILLTTLFIKSYKIR
jgi:hypothetical protein